MTTVSSTTISTPNSGNTVASTSLNTGEQQSYSVDTTNSINNKIMSMTYTSQRMLNESPVNHTPNNTNNHQHHHNQNHHSQPHHHHQNHTDLNNNNYIMYPPQTQLQPQQSQHQRSTANKLKLLKKRHALKKTLSSLTKTLASSMNTNVTSTNGSVAVNNSSSQLNNGVMKNTTNTHQSAYLINGSQIMSKSNQFDSGSREDFSKSQNNLNTHPHNQHNNYQQQQHHQRATSVHFSRNSLNQAEGGASNYRKSIETLDGGETIAENGGVAEHEDITDVKFNSFSNNLNRVISTPHINAMNRNTAVNQGFGMPGHHLSSNQKVCFNTTFT